MEPFTLQIPTKIVFGKGVLTSIGTETAAFGRKALLLYGGGSIKKNGVYDTITASSRRENIEITEYSGVKPNPVLSHAEAGVELAKQHGIDCIIAAGGGSVIDEGKAIAIGAKSSGPLWNFFDRTTEPKTALPLIAVQTMPATSSEMNMISVLTNVKKKQKFSCRSPLLYPKIAFLDPSVTLTIPPKQTACACTDIMAHVMEGYFFSKDPWPVVQEGYAEGIMRAVKLSMDRLLDNFNDYDARAAVMWAGTLAWNGVAAAGLKGAGVPNHMLAHPLSALYDITHGASLSIILPAWLHRYKGELKDKIRSFGKKVLGLPDSEARDADAVIKALIKWYRTIGTPVSFQELGISEPDLEELTREALELRDVWGLEGYSESDIKSIYKSVT